MLGIVLSAPGQTIGFSVFTDHLIEALKLSRVQLSLCYGIGTVCSSLIIGHVGKLMDRYGVRIIATMATFDLGVTLLVLSQIDRICFAVADFLHLQSAVIVCMLGITTGFFFSRFFGQGVMTLASRTMVMRWFDQLRGRVNSIRGFVSGLMFSAAPLVFEFLIQTFSWRGAWVFLGVAIGIGFSIFVILFYRNTPQQHGLIPDGLVAENNRNNARKVVVSERDIELKEGRRTLAYWIFNATTSMFSLYITALSFHIVSVFSEAGLAKSRALAIFVPAALISMGINLSGGFAADSRFFKYRLNYLAMISLGGILLSSLGVVLLHKPIGFLLIIAGNGIAAGLFSTLSTVVWPRYFGTKNLGAYTGANMSYMVFTSAIGPLMFSLALRLFDSYTAAALGCSAIAVGLIIAAFFVKRPTQIHPQTHS